MKRDYATTGKKLRTQLDTPKTRTGNTKKAVRSRGWCLTLNSPTNTDISTLKNWADTYDMYVIQLEIGHRTGTRHLQGFIYHRNAIMFTTLKNAWPKAHWEPMKGSISDNVTYCSKSDTYAGVRMAKGVEIRQEAVWDDMPKWAEDLLRELMEKPDYRKIIWYYDADGNRGKSRFCKWYCMTHLDGIVVGGKASDMKYGIVRMNPKPRVIFIDVSRSRNEYLSYEGIEEIKNGCFFSGKYESGMCIYDNPHVVIFSNELPIESNLSKDRWDIRNFDDL